jgi:feruloyl esterase
MAGVIDYANMLTQLNSGLGFAVAGGNAGHFASDNNNGGGAPGVYLPYLHDEAQVQAWIHNAISLFTPAARDLVKAYYGQSARYSYYDGCSTGGAQGFALAQLHPELFDGIYAGSPGNWYSHLALSFLWNAQQTNVCVLFHSSQICKAAVANHAQTSATNLTQDILSFITNAVLDTCDALDGVQDRLTENPLRCSFDIDSLACNGSSSYGSSTSNDTGITCLTESQLVAVKEIYAGPVRSDNGSQLYPGFSFGSENEWLLQEGVLADAFSIPILQNLVYDNLSYDSNTFNWASDVQDVDARAGRLIDEISPDLSAFHKRGGRMLTTQGWADPFNAAIWPIQHLEQLQNFFGMDVSDFYELFMVPGGGHCGAASYYTHVPATYHVVPALVEWVERGEKPQAILSTNPPDKSNTTRRLCAWPATARYVQGDEDNWNSYVCE